MSHCRPRARSGVVMCAWRRHSSCHHGVSTLRWSGSGASEAARRESGVLASSAATVPPAGGGGRSVRWRRPSSGGDSRLRLLTEAEFVLVVGGDQVVFHLGFLVDLLCHEVVEFGSALLVFGPFGGVQVRGTLQEDSVCRRWRCRVDQQWWSLGIAFARVGRDWNRRKSAIGGGRYRGTEERAGRLRWPQAGRRSVSRGWELGRRRRAACSGRPRRRGPGPTAPGWPPSSAGLRKIPWPHRGSPAATGRRRRGSRSRREVQVRRRPGSGR